MEMASRALAMMLPEQQCVRRSRVASSIAQKISQLDRDLEDIEGCSTLDPRAVLNEGSGLHSYASQVSCREFGTVKPANARSPSGSWSGQQAGPPVRADR